eukprot:TRINITY_DN63614_c0_g1_i1.p1 TRINITY_DN63614_c0_g1~~TRINITY_DN63614_c0_g1_i1.p1  ORF type:complete len:142 (-),score=17.96 TRINITY_DN63614_c0_g1_i1:48-473(-)
MVWYLWMLAMALGIMLQGCCGGDHEYDYDSYGASDCSAGREMIDSPAECECAAAELNAGWDGKTTRYTRPSGCYRYGDTGANFNSGSGSDPNARPICRVVEIAAAPPAPTTTLSSCCQALLSSGGRRLDGPSCTVAECEAR